jgi:hypothetical protein
LSKEISSSFGKLERIERQKEILLAVTPLATVGKTNLFEPQKVWEDS